MDVREKLVDLIHKAKLSMWGKNGLSNEKAQNSYISDYLFAHGVTVQEWISVKDRLPEKDIRVLVWMQDNEEGYTQIDTDRFSCTMEQSYHWIRWGKSVTHWMSLPQPPKGE